MRVSGVPFSKEVIMGSFNPQGGTQGAAKIAGGGIGEGPGPDVMAAATLDGNEVVGSE